LKKTLIIAEAGVNHNGSLIIAKQLIDAAVNAGADVVKFQTFKAENLVAKSAPKADYQIKITKSDESQYDMLKALELSYNDHLELISYCKEKRIEFLSSPFDEESILLLKRLGINIGKIPSGEITNLPYLIEMAKNFTHIILSTGMSSMAEIKEALDIIVQNGIAMENITVLQCNTEYPTPFEDVNLNAMLSIGSLFHVKIGYSDHTPGIEASIAAVALGATVIEKHFTLDNSMSGPDHKASLEPQQLQQLVSSIRNVEKALGNAVKEASDSEKKNISVARKSIHVNKALQKGSVVTKEDLVMKRPGDGISPMRMFDIVGKKVITDIAEDHKINFSDLI